MKNRAGSGGFKDWQELRDHTIEAFHGETPHAATEQDIIDAYQRHPTAIEKAVAEVAGALAKGEIRSGWGILRARATKILFAPSNPTGQGSRNREKAISQAEAWIRHTGLHLTWPEILDTLFAPPAFTPTLEFLEQLDHDTQGNPGRPIYAPMIQAAIRRTKEVGQEPVPNTGGTLTDHDTPDLRDRLHTIWQERQPVARQLEHDDHQRAEQWKHQQEAIRQAIKANPTTTPTRLPPANETYFEPTPLTPPELAPTTPKDIPL